MQRFRIWILLFMLATAYGVVAGQEMVLEGTVLNAKTREPISYANVWNLRTGKGTISNLDGYFRLAVRGGDSVRISYIGFKEFWLVANEKQKKRTVFLVESVQILTTVTVTPDDDDYLYDLIRKCKESGERVTSSLFSRGYFELKSYQNDAQLELVEGYYNVESKGYEIRDLQLKTGRIALQPFIDRLYVSLESSTAMVMHQLLEKNQSFPESILELSGRRMRKAYYLDLEKRYLNEQSDSVYVVAYRPKEADGKSFQGKLWLNTSKNYIEKVSLNVRPARVHPFLPLFLTDSISNVSIELTKTYQLFKGKPAISHVDFVYVLDYASRMSEEHMQLYAIKTRALLYAYQPERPFASPQFDFGGLNFGDYKKINAYPYLDFFWKDNEEYRLNDGANSNDVFFNDPQSITNSDFFDPNSYLKKGFLQSPFVMWSTKRILLKDLIADTIPDPRTSVYQTNKYKLDVQVFYDVISHKDSLHQVSAVVFNPYGTFYHLPIDQKTHCFVNLFFDLCEIERRKWVMELARTPFDEGAYLASYQRFVGHLKQVQQNFLKEVDRGTNEMGVMRYNELIKKELSIDNVALFQPFEKTKPKEPQE